MFSEYSNVKRPQVNLIFRILFIAALALFLVASQPVKAGPSPIRAAPGQAVGDYIVLESGTWINLTPPADIAGWILDPGNSPTTRFGTLIVDSIGAWQVKVSPGDASGGYLAEYDINASQYVPGRRLISAMKILAEGGNEVDLSEGGVLVEGYGKQMINVIFEQPVSSQDLPPHEGCQYKISMIFRAYNI